MSVKELKAIESVARLRLMLAQAAVGAARREREDALRRKAQAEADLQTVRVRAAAARTSPSTQPALAALQQRQMKALTETLRGRAHESGEEAAQLEHRIEALQANVRAQGRKSDVLSGLRVDAERASDVAALENAGAETLDAFGARPPQTVGEGP